MPTLPISEIEPGDILTQPVFDPMGNQLVAAGVEVTKALLTVLQRRGVTVATIAGVDEVDEDAPSGQERVEIEDRPSQSTDLVIAQLVNDMRERLVIGFERHIEDIAMAVLYKSATDYLTRKIHARVESEGV